MKNLPAQMQDHVFDHVVALDQEAGGFDLTRRVAIAYMPRKPKEIGPSDLAQCFGLCADFYKPTVREPKDHTLIKADGFVKIDKERVPAIRGQAFAAYEAAVVVQRAP